MNKNIKIAKDLIKLAKLLIADHKSDFIKTLQNYKKWIKNKPDLQADNTYSYQLAMKQEDYKYDLEKITENFNNMEDTSSFFDGDAKEFIKHIEGFKEESDMDKLIEKIKSSVPDKDEYGQTMEKFMDTKKRMENFLKSNSSGIYGKITISNYKLSINGYIRTLKECFEKIKDKIKMKEEDFNEFISYLNDLFDEKKGDISSSEIKEASKKTQDFFSKLK